MAHYRDTYPARKYYSKTEKLKTSFRAQFRILPTPVSLNCRVADLGLIIWQRVRCFLESHFHLRRSRSTSNPAFIFSQSVRLSVRWCKRMTIGIPQNGMASYYLSWYSTEVRVGLALHALKGPASGSHEF